MMDRLLFTGGTGFLGHNVRPMLETQYEVTTCGITDKDEIKANLAIEVPKFSKRFDLVLHAAGKAHVVPKTDEEKQQFYDINFQGTVNLCKALETVGPPKALVFISTVAVYGLDSGELISEDHPLNGTSPYAQSKIMAERYLSDWCLRHDVTLGILRPSLLAGKNAPGNLGAMVKGIKAGYYVNIAGGNVRKSIMMAEDIAELLPLVAEKGGIYNVCDSYHPTFGEISRSVAKQLGEHAPWSIPYRVAWCVAKVGDLLGRKFPFNSYRLSKMVDSLTFSNEKARRELGWEPKDVLTSYEI